MPFPFNFWEIAIGVFVATFVAMPIITVVHEMGHAVLALLLSRERVVVLLGNPPTRIEFHVGRLHLVLGGYSPAGACLWMARRSSPGARIAVALGGGLATALLIPAFLWLMAETWDLPRWIPASCLVAAMVALIDLLTQLDPRSKEGDTGEFSPTRDGPIAWAEYRARR